LYFLFNLVNKENIPEHYLNIFRIILKTLYLHKCEESVSDDISDQTFIVKLMKKEITGNPSNFEIFKNKLFNSQQIFDECIIESIKENGKKFDNLKKEAELLKKDDFYERVFYPIYKIFKLFCLISLNQLNITKNERIIKKNKEELISLKSIIKDISQKINIYIDLKKKIQNKYECKTNSKSSIQENENGQANGNPITNFKVLMSSLENNYILLLKNLSRKIMKPKELFKKSDPNYMPFKIK
jgi:hypothetical protein